MKKIICTNFILMCLLLVACSSTGSSSNVPVIGEDQAVEIVMAEHNLSKDSIENVQVSLEEGLIRDSYVITFDLLGHTYNYGVNTVTGKITYISVN